MVLVYDTEGDGFLDTITNMWCLVAKDIETGEVFKYRPEELEEALTKLEEASTLICHNQIGYDLPVLEKLYDWSPKESTQIIDTYVMSMLLWPDRPLPRGYRGKGGTHSIEAWGFRLGRWKPEHEDWTKFSPEMLHRCEEDVEIQALVYEQLIKEMA